MILERRRHLHPGFTFMELVVVILILGLLAGVGVPMYMRWAETARENTTKSNLALLKNNVNLFRMEHTKYPEKLMDLVEKPKGELGKGWKPYYEKLPKDGWTNEFYYRITTGSKYPYELYSYGSSGPEEEDPEGRISVWDL